MNFYSPNNSIFINKKDPCTYEFEINPSFIGSGGGSGLTHVNVQTTPTVILSGDGGALPLFANVVVSIDVGNVLQARSTGLYVPTPATYTDANARAALSTNFPLTYNSTSGVIGLPQASATQSGYLSSTDWIKFNENVGLLAGTFFS